MTKNWMDPAELARDSSVFGSWVLVLAGIALWDVISTLRFDISIITGKRPWRWPMALYFICRICLLLHILPFAVNLNAIGRIDCQGATWVSKVADAVGTCCSSIILLLRTTAVWHQNKAIWIPLCCLSVGQIVLWVQTFRFSVSTWSDQRKSCLVTATAPNSLIVAVFSYTMAFDFIIMALCSYRLYKSRNNGGIGSLIFRDGLVYFGAAFGANLVQTIMAGLALNPITNIIALPFALVVSTMAATAVFRNVFTLYDGFSKTTSHNQSGSTSAGGFPAAGPAGLSRLTVGRPGAPKSAQDSYALGELRSVEVHKTVEVEREAHGAPYMPTAYKQQMRSVPEDDGVSTSTSDHDRDEKVAKGF